MYEGRIINELENTDLDEETLMSKCIQHGEEGRDVQHGEEGRDVQHGEEGRSDNATEEEEQS